MSDRALFQPFTVPSATPTDPPLYADSFSSPPRLPAGSRLSQYIQGRKNATSPSFLVGAVDSTAFVPASARQNLNMSAPNAGATPFTPMSSTPSTSGHQLDAANQSMSGLSLQANCFQPSSTQSAFQPSHPNSFTPLTNSRMTPTANAFVPREGAMGGATTPVAGANRRILAKSPMSSTTTPDSGMQSFYQEYIGGTTYFYHPGTGSTSSNVSEAQFVQQPVAPLLPNVHVYSGPPAHISNFRPKNNASSFFAPGELKMELMHRQLLTLAQVSHEQYPELPLQMDHFRNFVPLEAKGSERPGFYMGHITTNYKATSVRDGVAYSIRRIHNCRQLLNPKSMGSLDIWKKLIHSNVVQLREVMTTQAFGDYSLVLVYDYHPGAETIKYRHFSANNPIASQSAIPGMESPMKPPTEGSRGPPKFGGGMMAESQIWSYIIQLSSALRCIHSAGLAARTVDPSKILIFSKTKILLNGCGILDLLTSEQMPVTASCIATWQQEDLVGLGRLVVALACSSLISASREMLMSSINYVAQNYSADLKNLVTYLVSPAPGRMKNVNDIMPMIGARFYAQLETSMMKNDILENELSKEVENGRLFRVLCKLGTVNERPEFEMDPSWCETGDRYLLKLFRDYVFHQNTPEGRPWLDLAHVVSCLNKLDAGCEEKLTLYSRDDQNVLIVTYADLRKCLEQSFRDLLAASGDVVTS